MDAAGSPRGPGRPPARPAAQRGMDAAGSPRGPAGRPPTGNGLTPRGMGLRGTSSPQLSARDGDPGMPLSARSPNSARGVDAAMLRASSLRGLQPGLSSGASSPRLGLSPRGRSVWGLPTGRLMNEDQEIKNQMKGEKEAQLREAREQRDRLREERRVAEERAKVVKEEKERERFEERERLQEAERRKKILLAEKRGEETSQKAREEDERERADRTWRESSVQPCARECPPPEAWSQASGRDAEFKKQEAKLLALRAREEQAERVKEEKAQERIRRQEIDKLQQVEYYNKLAVVRAKQEKKKQQEEAQKLQERFKREEAAERKRQAMLAGKNQEFKKEAQITQAKTRAAFEQQNESVKTHQQKMLEKGERERQMAEAREVRRQNLEKQRKEMMLQRADTERQEAKLREERDREEKERRFRRQVEIDSKRAKAEALKNQRETRQVLETDQELRIRLENKDSRARIMREDVTDASRPTWVA